MKGKNATVVLVNFLSLASGLATSTNDLKRILVTGANKGIGKAICQRLLTEWEDTHVILGSRDTARGKQAVEDLIQQGCPADRLELLHIDTSNDESVEKAAASLGDTNLFGIINNAGVRNYLSH